MSHTTQPPDPTDSVSLEKGLEALASSPEFRGPVEALDGHACNDHFAQIYETDGDRFAASIPFVRHGLERGDRCIYVVDEHTESEVKEAFRAADLDLDEAISSGALTFYTVQDTYLRNGTFEPDEMVDFYGELAAEVTEEYEALRIVAETTWLQDDATTVEQFMEYESKVNDLFADEDCLAICQYDRDGFPPEIIRDIVRTHPHLIYEETVSHNVYYTPPGEFFGSNDPAQEVDRMLGTLQERAEAKAALEERERFLTLQQDVTASPDLGFREKLQELFELGCDRFGTEIAGLARVDVDEDVFEVEHVNTDHEHMKPGAELPLSETYCTAATDIESAASVSDPVASGYDDIVVYEEFGIDAYLGTYLDVDGGPDRTFFFLSSDPRDEPFTQDDRTFVRLMGQWVRYELERELRERFLRDSYAITSNSDLAFDEKVARLLDLGRDRFDLDVGYFARADPKEDLFEIVEAVGSHDRIQPGAARSLSESYCVRVLGSDEPVCVTDAAAEDWDNQAYDTYGLDTYIGTELVVDGEQYGTLCFGSDTPRSEPFSEAERTFLDLMSQWISYELDRRRQERYLRESYEITSDPDRTFEEKLERLLDLGRERFGLEMAGLNHLPSWEGEFRLEKGVGLGVDDEELWTDLSDGGFCRQVIDGDEPVGMTDVAGTDWADDSIYRRFGLTSYLGTKVTSSTTTYGSLWFGSTEPRDRPFTDAERTFLELMGQWVSYELERQEHNRYQQQLQEITADPDRTFEQKLERLLELLRERFGIEGAGLSHLPSWDGEFLMEHSVGFDEDGDDSEIWTNPAEGCFCREAIASDDPVGMADVRGTEWADDSVHREFGLTSYLGTKVTSGATPYGTLWVASSEPRDRPFTDAERTFLELLGQWVSYELERREQNRYQHRLYEISADADRTFEQKLDELLELGADRFGLETGMLTREHEDAFAIERMAGTHPDLDEGTITSPMTDNYCRRVVDEGEPLAVEDAGEAGWDADALYSEFDLQCYAGVPVSDGDGYYGTICFTGLSPREAGFTEAERSFLELLGQWVSYELERQHREDRLAAVNTLSRELMDAETAEEVAEYIVDAAGETLDLPVTAIARYDDMAGRLEPTARTDHAAALLEETSLLSVGDGPGWNAFVEGESRVVTGSLADADVSVHPPITAVAAFPLGRYGVLVTGSTASDGLRGADLDFVETVAANTRAALDRADREQQLQDREATLQEQNETLERLNRINDIIRNIDQALVQASSRAEIERVVCEELADVGPYELAWIGDLDTATETVTPRESAGTDQGYLDDITITADESPEGMGPTGLAVRTRETQVVNDVLEDRSFEPWRQDALNRGYHATIALPLVYEETLYGILNVYAGEPGVFDDLERAVLDELADTIAYAINAAESKKALLSDEVTELEFTVDDRSLSVVELVREVGCEFSQESLVPRNDGRLQAFFSTRGVAEETVREVIPRLPVTDVELVSEYEEDGERVCLFEGTLTDESLPVTVLEHGGRIKRIEAAGESATVTAHLAADANVREFTEMLRRTYPTMELTAQRARERSKRTVSEARATLTEALTDRQLEALQTAYVSGYFDQPRDRTASEIAETMEIAQPTFNAHLRAANRKLCRQLFDDHGPED